MCAATCTGPNGRSAAMHWRIMNAGHRETHDSTQSDKCGESAVHLAPSPAVEAQRASMPSRESRGYYVSERYRKSTARYVLHFSSCPARALRTRAAAPPNCAAAQQRQPWRTQAAPQWPGLLRGRQRCAGKAKRGSMAVHHALDHVPSWPNRLIN